MKTSDIQEIYIPQPMHVHGDSFPEAHIREGDTTIATCMINGYTMRGLQALLPSCHAGHDGENGWCVLECDDTEACGRLRTVERQRLLATGGYVEPDAPG
jgi:hypothetical protein